MRVALVGGSDAGIEAARRCRELSPGTEVSVLVADRYPNLSICGLPYWHSREVARWQDLAHRTVADLESTGMRLLLDHRVIALDLDAHNLTFMHEGRRGTMEFDRLVVGTGAHPVRPPIDGLDELGPSDGVHVLHTMPDAFALDTTAATASRNRGDPRAVIVGAGYVGVEMAEALTTRGLQVVLLEQQTQVLPRTLDPELADQVRVHLAGHGVDVQCEAEVSRVGRNSDADSGVTVAAGDQVFHADLVLVATGVRPAVELAVAAGIELGATGAIAVDRRMRTSAADVWAAGPCVHTHHRLTGSETYLPLGTTAHKQGRVAGENVASQHPGGGDATYAGSLGTQAVKVFDLVAAATGLRDVEARDAGFDPITVPVTVDDHKAYYPGAADLIIRLTGDRRTGRLLGGQLLGAYGAEVSKRVDVLAAANHTGATVAGLSDLDLSYTPPLAAPWDALQQAAHAWAASLESPLASWPRSNRQSRFSP